MAELTKEFILDEITTISRQVFNNPDLVVNESSSANTIAEWDSITNLFFIDSIEKKFDIKFSIDEIMNANNVGDLCNVILARN